MNTQRSSVLASELPVYAHSVRAESPSLAEQLQLIGMPPFPSEWVEHYKAEQLAKANIGLWQDRLLAFADRLVTISLWPLIMAMCYGWFISWQIGLGSLIFLVLSSTAVVHLSKKTIRDKAEWQLVPYHSYRGFVPSHVRSVLDLFGPMQDVEFSIDQLVQNRRQIDPFIHARRGSEAYHFAVWHEPEWTYSRS